MTIKRRAAVTSNYVGPSVKSPEDEWSAPCISVMCHPVAIAYTAGEAGCGRKDATKPPAPSSVRRENNKQ